MLLVVLGSAFFILHQRKHTEGFSNVLMPPEKHFGYCY